MLLPVCTCTTWRISVIPGWTMDMGRCSEACLLGQCARWAVEQLECALRACRSPSVVASQQRVTSDGTTCRHLSICQTHRTASINVWLTPRDISPPGRGLQAWLRRTVAHNTWEDLTVLHWCWMHAVFRFHSLAGGDSSLFTAYSRPMSLRSVCVLRSSAQGLNLITCYNALNT